MKVTLILCMLLVALITAGNTVNHYNSVAWGSSIVKVRQRYSGTVKKDPENSSVTWLMQNKPSSKMSYRQFYFYKGKLFKIYVQYLGDYFTGNFVEALCTKLKNNYGTHNSIKDVSTTVKGIPLKGSEILWKGTTEVLFKVFDAYNNYGVKTGESLGALVITSTAINKKKDTADIAKRSEEIEF